MFGKLSFRESHPETGSANKGIMKGLEVVYCVDLVGAYQFVIGPADQLDSQPLYDLCIVVLIIHRRRSHF